MGEAMKIHFNRKQFPDRKWTFVDKKTGERDSGILPANFGESNRFARWQRSSWISRKFANRASSKWNAGKGPSGLLGRMKFILIKSKYYAKKSGHKPAHITAEDMVKQWQTQKGKCAACCMKLNLMRACFDHNHKTGEPRGFIHRICNMAEGQLLLVPNLKNFLTWYRKTR
jgi:hypothetical protein